MKWKEIFTSWRIILLILFLVFSIVSIRPQIFGTEGVMITSVVPDSAASLAGIENPSGNLHPLDRERILAIDRVKVNSVAEYYNSLEGITPNSSVSIETNERIYTLLVREDLGMKVSETPSSNLKKGLDLAGGTRVLLKPATEVSKDDLDLTIDSLKERLNVYGLSDIVVRSASDLAGEAFILVEIAGVTEEEVKELIAKQGKFEASIANETVFFGGKKDITYVCRSADCSGIDPNRGCSTAEGGNAFCTFFFTITLTPEAAERQAKLTNSLDVLAGPDEGYLSEDLILYLDDVEVDSLRIGAELKGRATTSIQISGSGSGRTREEAMSVSLQNMKKLQTIIVTGSLPVKLEIVKLDTISPSLGQEFLDNILLVGLLAILAVVTVVSIRYRKLKIVIPMVLTLLSELVLILGFGSLIGWNMDLAAIAGIIIVAGTGVDHLIVITDETLSGEVSHGWKRKIKNAMFIVVGAYLTTVAGMMPLLWAGAGLLKGFALTTIAGISFGVLIARPAFATLIEKLLE